MANRVNVGTDEDGFILVNGERITPREARDTALNLVEAIEDSLNRNQKNTPRYHSTEEILRRMNSPLGRATNALRKVF